MRGTKFMIRMLFLAAVAVFASTPFPVLARVRGVEHVVIIGVDGMGAHWIEKAETPHMHALMARGAWSLHARAVMPTSSSPNWASMIMGAGPEQHGVHSNDWKPDKHPIDPIAVGAGGIFPTIYQVMREQRPKAVIGVFHDWADYARLLEPKAVNKIEHPKGPDATAQAAVAYIKEAKPDFTFIHLDHVDHAGHDIGWGTDAYLKAVAHADELIGEVEKGLAEAGILDKTIILVTADHGGVLKGHGGSTMAEIEIPWIIAGPRVARGKQLTAPINTYDTAATVAYIFGLQPPDCWIARPVKAAFGK